MQIQKGNGSMLSQADREAGCMWKEESDGFRELLARIFKAGPTPALRTRARHDLNRGLMIKTLKRRCLALEVLKHRALDKVMRKC